MKKKPTSTFPANYWAITGFTLLEVLVAISILAIVLVAALQSQSYSILWSQDSKFRTTAALLTQICIAEIELRGSPVSGTMKGTFSDDYPGFSWQVEILSSPFPKTKKFKITIANKQSSPEREYVTYYYALER